MLEKLFKTIKQQFKITSQSEKIFNRLGLIKVIDLIFHYPRDIVVKKYVTDLEQVKTAEIVIIELEYKNTRTKTTANGKKLTTLECEHVTGAVDLVYFNFYPNYILQKLRFNKKLVVVGKIEKNADFQIKHPKEIYVGDMPSNVNLTEPVYPLTYGMTNHRLEKMIKKAISMLDHMPEWLPKDYVLQSQSVSFNEAIHLLHNPKNQLDVSPFSQARKRLAMDELLATQIELKLLRKIQKNNAKISIKGNGTLRTQLKENLPFTLTDAQIMALEEIYKDQEKSSRMMRLLQGDVGSGKTVVALFSALNTIEAGFQAAILAPTELLAIQHYKWIRSVSENVDIKIGLLIGKTKQSEKKELLQALKNQQIDLLIGTHAIFQEKVEFADLRLIIIDEQHRFGVNQRMQLLEKGNRADMLLMTATPIPRSLCMTIYGDMDVTKIQAKPTGRKPIITTSFNIKNWDMLQEKLQKAVAENKKIYWLCPLIEGQEDTQEDDYVNRLAPAIERHQHFDKLFPGKVGLVHGRMKPQERDIQMLKFAGSEYNILVATTVVEVGIDVSDATIMFIENAERFGLSQLHQLRGRVGRSSQQSYCILLAKYPMGKIAKDRIQVMKETNDGFLIAERDLDLRGSGDVLGTKQSGMPDFKFADLECHRQELYAVNALATKICDNLPLNDNIKNLLQLFGKKTNFTEGDREIVLEHIAG